MENKNIGLIIFGSIVVMSIALMLVIIFEKRNEITATPSPTVTINPTSVASGKQQYDKTIAETNKLDANRQYSEVASELKQYIASNPPDKERLQASLKLAAAYFNAKDYDQAIVWYERIGNESDAYKMASYHGLAHCYRVKGDIDKAVAYYQKNIEYVKKKNPKDAELIIAGDEQAIKILKKEY